MLVLFMHFVDFDLGFLVILRRQSVDDKTDTKVITIIFHGFKMDNIHLQSLLARSGA